MDQPVAPASLPVDAVVPELLDALDRHGTAVLQAPPGSGKSTRVPLALLGSPWLAQRRVLVLEPRRVAARAVARRMAATLGEEPGGQVGYLIRQERRVSPRTRVEVVTEGVLTRLLQADPSLDGAGAVIFDEYHERSIHADLGLALTLDVRSGLRPDLRVLVMSATLDTAAVATLLGGAPVVTAEATAYPVETVWLGRPSGAVPPAVARAVVRAALAGDGDVLAFLPGAAEIRTVARILGEDAGGVLRSAGADVVTLSGAQSSRDQDAALRPAPAGRRKIVLATSVAETSLTIDGVRAVVDSGLMRAARFDPAAGMARLVTLPVSRAAADQRRGRAARQAPGTCYRLWSAAEHSGLPRSAPAEILVADLAPLALDLAEWGVDDPGELRWVDPPPEAPLRAARELLAELGALDADHRITAVGRRLARLGVHPRLGHLLLEARTTTDGSGARSATVALACDIAAVVDQGDPRRGVGTATGAARGGADLTDRVVALRQGRDPRLSEASSRWQRLLASSGRGADVPAPSGTPRPGRGGGGGAGSSGSGSGGHDRRPTPARAAVASSGGRIPSARAVIPEDVGRLLALAYPDRVGRRRPGRPGHWLLRNGKGAWVAETDPLASAEWVVAADLDGDPRQARVWLGAPMSTGDVEELFGADIVSDDRVAWDERRGDVVAVRERRLGALTVSTATLGRGDPQRAAAALLDGIRSSGLGLLPWTAELERLRARVAFARRIEGDGWTDLSDEALMAELDSWLAPAMAGRARRAELTSLPLGDALWARIGWDRRRQLDELAPTHLRMPAGDRRRLDYPAEGPPVLAARVQELFGTTTTPTVAGGRVPVVMHLLSPAGRPVQVTTDLAGFWASTYKQVRSELRARYPRHPWPDDPATATPATRARPRRGR